MIFYFLSALVIYGALGTVFRKNPLTSALHLALTMIGLAGLFFQMGAHFIAGVQLVVYAGAVMVLFVMVIMLFDSQKKPAQTEKKPHNFLSLKVFLSVFIFGLLSGIVPHSSSPWNKIVSPEETSTMSLAKLLFSDYTFLFEWLGVLLLIVAVGTVLLSRSESHDYVD